MVCGLLPIYEGFCRFIQHLKEFIILNPNIIFGPSLGIPKVLFNVFFMIILECVRLSKSVMCPTGF